MSGPAHSTVVYIRRPAAACAGTARCARHSSHVPSRVPSRAPSHVPSRLPRTSPHSSPRCRRTLTWTLCGRRRRSWSVAHTHTHTNRHTQDYPDVITHTPDSIFVFFITAHAAINGSPFTRNFPCARAPPRAGAAGSTHGPGPAGGPAGRLHVLRQQAGEPPPPFPAPPPPPPAPSPRGGT